MQVTDSYSQEDSSQILTAEEEAAKYFQLFLAGKKGRKTQMYSSKGLHDLVRSEESQHTKRCKELGVWGSKASELSYTCSD